MTGIRKTDNERSDRESSTVHVLFSVRNMFFALAGCSPASSQHRWRVLSYLIRTVSRYPGWRAECLAWTRMSRPAQFYVPRVQPLPYPKQPDQCLSVRW